MVFRQSYDRRRLRPSYRMSRTSASDPLRTFPAGLWCRVRFVPVCLVSVGSVTASAAFAQTSVPVEGAAGAKIQLTPPQTCSSSSLEGEIVVCGKRSDRCRIARSIGLIHLLRLWADLVCRSRREISHVVASFRVNAGAGSVRQRSMATEKVETQLV
jgi:hypothetical protein